MTPRRRWSRADRRTDHPAYPLEQVLDLVRRQFVLVELKAAREAVRFFGDDVVLIGGEIKEVLLELTADEWCFRQEQDGEWVDVYRIEFEPPPPAWVKLKIETAGRYQVVAIISFHEFDDEHSQ